MITNHEIDATVIAKLSEMLTDCAPDFMQHVVEIGSVWTTVSRVTEPDPILTYGICTYDLPLKIADKYGIDTTQSSIKTAGGTVTNLYQRWKSAKK